MGRKPNDLTGQQFGRLTVVKRDFNKTNKVYWVCECSCGNTISVLGADLTRKSRPGTKSCGCLTKDVMSKVKKKYNQYDLSGNFGTGYTLKGEEFYFDLEDYDKIKNFCWNIKEGYVVSSKNNKTVRMHRMLVNAKDGEITDHINRDKKDNRKSNLRIVTPRANCINISRRKDNISGKTGVHHHTRDNKWVASISVNGKQKEILRTYNKEDAIKAREMAEFKHYGEFSPNYSKTKAIVEIVK